MSHLENKKPPKRGYVMRPITNDQDLLIVQNVISNNQSIIDEAKINYEVIHSLIPPIYKKLPHYTGGEILTTLKTLIPKTTMKIKQITSYDEEDYQSFLSIYIDDKKVCDFADGEPEDANLSRDFADCYNIVELLQQAYQAGKDGQELIVEKIDMPFEEFCG